MMLRRLLPLVGAAGATALFGLMGIAPASAQSYFSIQFGQGHHRHYRDCDRNYDGGYVYVAPPRWDRDRYEHRDWDRDRDRDRGHDRWDGDRDRGDHRHRR
ncbi:MAG TPA: hypothetical protein VFA07_16150 [Chthonomonadaceae bacterium]|nr:hypothetical protein [Chthonomonadaceae bacterium]